MTAWPVTDQTTKETTMCLCGIPYHDYLCDTHRQQAEHREGRHAGVCDRMEPLAEWLRRTEDEWQ